MTLPHTQDILSRVLPGEQTNGYTVGHGSIEDITDLNDTEGVRSTTRTRVLDDGVEVDARLRNPDGKHLQSYTVSPNSDKYDKHHSVGGITSSRYARIDRGDKFHHNHRSRSLERVTNIKPISSYYQKAERANHGSMAGQEHVYLYDHKSSAPIGGPSSIPVRYATQERTVTRQEAGPTYAPLNTNGNVSVHQTTTTERTHRPQVSRHYEQTTTTDGPLHHHGNRQYEQATTTKHYSNKGNTLGSYSNYSTLPVHPVRQSTLSSSSIRSARSDVSGPRGHQLVQHSHADLSSPFSVNVVSSTEQVRAGGAGLGFVPVRRLSFFTINAQEAGDAPVNVLIKSPEGRECPCNVIPQGNYLYKVEWNPQVVGDHRVEITYSNLPIGGSPFVARVYDSSKVQVTHINQGKLGKQCTFKVDASKAGAGNLEIIVSVRGENVPNYVSSEGNARFLVSFTPQIPDPHRVSIRFNDEPVQGSPYTVDVIDTRNVTVHGEGLNSVRINTLASFTVDPMGPIAGDLDVRVTSPSGQSVPARVEIYDSNLYRVNFHPTEVGRHVIDVIYANEPVRGSPFYCEVYDVSRVRITDVTPDPKMNQEITFIVDASAAGLGDVDVEVLCNNHLVRTKREALNTNRHRYSFLPTDFGEYVISATFNYEQVPGSPVRIPLGPDFHRYTAVGPTTMAANTAGHFMVETQGAGVQDNQFDVSVTAPNGEKLPANILTSPAGDYKVDWKTPYVGRHTVDVRVAGQHISGSPYYVYVFDPSRVRVENIKKTVVGQECGFEVRVGEAGKAQLDVAIIGPNGQSVPFGRSGGDPIERITFYPTDPGTYHAHIKYGGFDVVGSPFVITVLGSATGIKAFGDGLFKGEEDKAATFYVDTQGGAGDLFVQVDGPNSLAKVNVYPENNMYRVSYVPVEVGLFDCIIRFNGQDIAGSPFHPKVVCPRKVRPVGGWQHVLDANDRLMLVLGEERKIVFECLEAGPGSLRAEVQGPDGNLVPVLVDPRGDGHTIVTFTPMVAGEYRVTALWEGIALPGSPIVGIAQERVAHQQHYNSQMRAQDHTKVILMGKGLREARMREQAEFFIDGSQAGPGEPRVQMTGTRGDVHVDVVHQGDRRYRCTYAADQQGAYLMHIMWNERQVKGSPFKLNVLASAESNKVLVEKDQFKMGMVDQELRTMIDTRKAGPGELTAHCMGPTKVAFCDLLDHGNGTFTLTVRPQEAGRHILQVKYGGEHIPGSPFVLRISGAPDASKVKVYGPGVESGMIQSYQSKFIVETLGAGAGQLTVRVRGPKGAFRVEMQRESQKDRTILCKYDPNEPGDYTMHVKWSGQHVPGSPFNVRICETQDELEQFVGRQKPIGYSQWNAEPTLY